MRALLILTESILFLIFKIWIGFYIDLGILLTHEDCTSQHCMSCPVPHVSGLYIYIYTMCIVPIVQTVNKSDDDDGIFITF